MSWVVIKWAETPLEEVPVVSVSGLERLAVDRLLRFERRPNPNHARYSPTNERPRPVRALAPTS